MAHSAYFTCNLPGIRFFTIFPQDAAQFLTRQAVHKIGSRRASLTHAHIQRRVPLVREPPRNLIQLMAGYAKVQQRAVQPRHTGAVQHSGRAAKVRLYDNRGKPG